MNLFSNKLVYQKHQYLVTVICVIFIFLDLFILIRG